MTCVCLTRNRREWLPKAIQYFQGQTYQNRELLILADGDEVSDLVPNDKRIRLIHLEGHPEIGEKRNLGCQLTRGDIIAHWDDDDYSAPERLADQIARLRETGKSVTGYHTMRFTDGAKWWLFWSLPHRACGTSLMYKREWWERNRFPSKQVGEDVDFVVVAHTAGARISVDAGDMMHASIHPGNSSPRPLDNNQWRELPA